MSAEPLGIAGQAQIRDQVWEQIIQELEQVKQHNMDKDGKKAIIPKDKVKEAIGRSPDFSDALMMRMWFEFEVKYIFADADYAIF